MLSAWLTLFPRTVSTTVRTLRGAMRMCVALALITTLLHVLSRLFLCTYFSPVVRFVIPLWARNVRVGENSPSLCPTMFSVTYTGTNLLPLCTAIVCPTISGRIVERRDHVRIARFSTLCSIARILSRRCASTNGPFFTERPIAPCSCVFSRPPLFPPSHNKLTCALIAPRFVSLRCHSLRRHRMASTCCPTFSSTT